MQWLESITDSVDTNLSKIRVIVEDSSLWVCKESDMT